MDQLAELFYLMLPTYLANMAPPFVRFWHGWNPPIHRRYLGEHKTVIGFMLGVGAGIAAAFFQLRVASVDGKFPYQDWFWFGLTMGLAAMLGDAAKSFVKRRLGIAAGQAWIPADQLDFVFAGLLVLHLWVPYSWLDALWIVALSFVGDVLINHVSFYFGIRTTKW